MSQYRALFSLFCIVPLGAQTVVPVPVREYDFNAGFADATAGPSLQSFGGALSGGYYVFGADQGLLLADPSLSAMTYTFEFLFKFDATSGYQRILDFQNRTSDTGLYSLGQSLNFYNVVSAAETDFSAGQPLQVVITRDGGTNQVSGYVNGQLRLSFTDSSNLAVFSGPGREMYFFMDDLAVGGEAAPGAVDLIRIFAEPLGADQVLELFQQGAPAVVPEPTTLLLLLLGLPGAIFFRRRLA